MLSTSAYIPCIFGYCALNLSLLSPTVPVSFPTGNSKPEQAARIQAALVALQNLHGPGVGCPAAATTLSAQLAAALS